MKNILQVILVFGVLTACSRNTKDIVIQTTQPDTPTAVITSTFSTTITPLQQAKETQSALVQKSTSTAVYTKTQVLHNEDPIPISHTPTPSKTRTPFSAPVATMTAYSKIFEATISALGAICDPPTQDRGSKISPDGLWISTVCRDKDSLSSYLRVLNIQNGNEWRIYHSDYSKGPEDYSWGEITPYHWTSNGKFLYADSGSRWDGCCWIGGDLLLVRLNLENGQQVEIANYINYGMSVPGVNFSISSNDRYVLYIPQDGKDNLFVLDTYNWKQRTIKIRFDNTGAGYTLMSNNSERILLALMEYPQEIQGDLTYGSLVLIDLTDGLQKKVLSGYDFWDLPLPERWQDDNHVILKMNSEFFLLTITTGDLEPMENP
jgi:hypothetical protein